MNQQDKQSSNDTGLTRKQVKEYMPGYHIPPVKREIKHEEADLHLQFCKWVKSEYPDLKFVRHEREKQRSKFMQNLMKVYNSDDDKLPDFELLDQCEVKLNETWTVLYNGFLIEFKKPGRTWATQSGVIKADCRDQYITHQHLWSIGRCTYFCNDLQDAKILLIAYLNGNPRPMQDYVVPDLQVNRDDLF